MSSGWRCWGPTSGIKNVNSVYYTGCLEFRKSLKEKEKNDGDIFSVAQFHLAAPTTSSFVFALLCLQLKSALCSCWSTFGTRRGICREGKKILTYWAFCRDVHTWDTMIKSFILMCFHFYATILLPMPHFTHTFLYKKYHKFEG